MKTCFNPLLKTVWLPVVCMLVTLLSNLELKAQATYAVPVSIGNYPCASGKGFVQFRYVSTTSTLSQLPPTTCNLSNLASPGFSEYSSGISFNPADTNLYYVRYNAPHTYVWRWKPGSACPPSTALLRVYNNTYVVGLAFDAQGMGYQLIYTGSSSNYGLALQSVNFTTGVLGPIIPVALPSGMNQLQGNGDFVITPTGQFLAILDNNYVTINYQDYNSSPLHATLINVLPGNKIIGLSYSDGKLVASDYYISSGAYRSNYYEVGIVDGVKTTITTAPCYFSTDMTDINTAIGTSKKLSSAVPTGTAGQYDICYDIYVQNYGNWPLENVSVTDNLGTIFQNSNISNVSVSLIDNPAGVTLNSGFNGRDGGVTELLATGSKLPASPSANNHFTIRICLRVSGINIGQVYNNNARASGRGYLNVTVRDVSTDGDNPDLNSNAKPDDPGEDRPTPFVISVAAEMPPCEALDRILYNQTFGTGSGMATAIPAATGTAGTATTGYTGSTSQPLAIERYALTNNANNGNTSRWISRTDNTTGSGRMMIVNADVQNNIIYNDRVNVPCGNLKYSLFAFVSNIANSSYQQFCTDAFGNIVYPKLNFIVRNTNGTIITNLTTPDITSANWTQFGMKFVMPAGISQVDIEIRNVGAGGCGNDLAIDDIQFGLCDPTPTVNVNAAAGCTSGITTFSAALSDPTVISGTLAYRWERSNNGSTWTVIAGANNVTYTINPLQPVDVGRYYRVTVASSTAELDNASCRYISDAFQLTAKSSSTAPTGITASPAQTTCPENPVTLTVQGGSLGTNAVWRWYTGSCGGTAIGTGSSIIVNPAATTTYYVRAEGDCNTTTCRNIAITVVPCVILPIEFQQFSAILRNKNVELGWRIVTSEQVDHFEIERSLDGSSFSAISSFNATMAANTTASFNYKDADINVNQPVYYYRIKVVGKNGTNKYSNILSVKLGSSSIDKMKVSPNPASSTVAVSFSATAKGFADYQLMDMTGKIVIKGQYRVEQGVNVLTLSELGRFSEGVYTVMLHHSGKWEYERLIIKR